MTFLHLGANIKNMKERYLSKPLAEHLKKLRQMVFLTGPRQIGKTTLAQSFLNPIQPGVNYFNWDIPEQRKILSTRFFPGKERLEGKDKEVIVFDEIHKYPRWKNTLKGLFDAHEPKTHWIITGSAMLNVFRRGQDSLLGRHFTYNLNPFSIAELISTSSKTIPSLSQLLAMEFSLSTSESKEAFQTLLQFSGFPEPLFTGEDSFLVRWRTNRLDRLINQDLAATETLRHLPLVEQLMFLLPERVGSPLSLNSLREDLEVHFGTVKHWMELLERVFYGFFLRPYAARSARILKKEAKWYLWDWTEIEEPSIRFENLVAVHLIKYTHYMNQLGLDDLSLHYVRDKEKREIDFLICQKKRPALLIECKTGKQEAVGAIKNFAKLLRVKRGIQLTDEATKFRIFKDEGITIQALDAPSFLQELI